MTTEELFRKMQWHVDREVRHYKNDFEIDKRTILEMIEAQRFGQYIWVTRECGTHLVPIGCTAMDSFISEEYLKSIRQTHPNRKEYVITLSPIGCHDFHAKKFKGVQISK